MPWEKTLAQELNEFLITRPEYEDDYFEMVEYFITEIKRLEKQNIEAHRELARAKNILDEAQQIKAKYGVLR